MQVVCFGVLQDSPLTCRRCARRLRRALAHVPGIEKIGVSLRYQRLAIGYNPVLLDEDDLVQRLAELGFGVRRLQGRIPLCAIRW
jgi:copper chaperone CopZ